MAHQKFRVNLASIIFPFMSQEWGRSIIVPQYDQNFERTFASPADVDKDKGFPQAYYMHNCMPTHNGWQSIGYAPQITGLQGFTNFDKCFTLYQTVDSNNNPAPARFLFVPAAGKNYIYDATVGKWVSVSPLPNGAVPSNVLVTTAYVNGQSYIFYSGYGCFVYDSVNKVLAPVTLNGLQISNVIGITASYGYMLAYTTNTLAWSSLTITQTDFIDFTPSLSTGAGGGSVQNIRGNIVAVLAIAGGIMVYCEKNVVGGTYSGNTNFPFIFVEVPGSGGVESIDVISWASNLPNHYAWTSVGLQQLNLNATQNLFPETTDFLAALFFEDFNEQTLQFTEQYLTAPLDIKLAAISDRYVVISYGVTSGIYTHAIVYDLVVARWGKLKITHAAAFQWPAPNLFGDITYGQLGNIGMTYGGLAGITYGELATSVITPEIPKKTLAFMAQDGTVQTVIFDLAQTTADGVLVLGKYQFQRNKRFIHQETEIENVLPGNTFSYYLLPTADGKTFLPPVKPFLFYSGPVVKKYKRRLDGYNMTSLLIGAFNVSSMVMDFTVGGDR